MGNRWGPRRGVVRARLGRWVATGLVVALLAGGPAAEMRAEGRLRALDHHAMVLNGDIVGSAFQVGEDVAVTNRHVVRGLGPGGMVTLLAARGGGSAEGRVIAISPRMDLALLRVPAGFLPAVGSEDAPEVAGLAVTAAGIDAGDGGGGERLALAGVVLDPREEIAAFGPGLVAWLPGARPGFSGGPMLDERGRFVGMVTAIRPAGWAGAVASAGGRPRGAQASVEAFVLRAAEVRAEVRRLLAAGG